MIKPGIGYMHVSGFNETTETEVGQALQQFGDLKGWSSTCARTPAAC